MTRARSKTRHYALRSRRSWRLDPSCVVAVTCHVSRAELLLLAIVALSCRLLFARTPRRTPFSVDDLVQLKRVSEPALSHDGKTVVFTVRETDMKANRGRTDLWSLDLATKGAQPRRITTHPENDGSPQWSNDGSIYFLSERSGRVRSGACRAVAVKPSRSPMLPLDVGLFQLSPDGASSRSRSRCSPIAPILHAPASVSKKNPSSNATGQVYDRIFIRHWDTWRDGRISQLYVLQTRNGHAVEPISLSGALDADVPSKPFGDASEYTFSPDSKQARVRARAQRHVSRGRPTSISMRSRVEGGEPRNLTADNPAWDTQPVFSPDGTLLAWRAMERPGFEADRFHIIVLDLKTGERRGLTKHWDRSVDSFAFSRDARTLFATTDHFGQHPSVAVELKSGKPTMLTGPGHVDAFSVGEKEIVFALVSLKSPAEL